MVHRVHEQGLAADLLLPALPPGGAAPVPRHNVRDEQLLEDLGVRYHVGILVWFPRGLQLPDGYTVGYAEEGLHIALLTKGNVRDLWDGRSPRMRTLCGREFFFCDVRWIRPGSPVPGSKCDDCLLESAACTLRLTLP